jgi:hypothetical protein
MDKFVIKRIAAAIVDTIKETPEGAPGGILYAACMSFGMSYEAFETLMSALVEVGAVEKRGQLYFATGK